MNQIYVEYEQSILILGYGCLGQGILPLLLKHIDLDTSKITVLEKDNNKDTFDLRHGNSNIKYMRLEITKENYKEELKKYLAPGGLLVNCSVDIDAESILVWCMENDVMQIDTSLETWPDDSDLTDPQRTIYHAHKTVRAAMKEYLDGPTCVVTHGANPGYVSHLAKRALLDLARSRNMVFNIPTSKEEWAQLMKTAGVKTIHISEQDTQIINKPKQLNEFVNTWSCHGFYNEGVAPAELGWGTHEEVIPPDGRIQGNTVYITQPGICTMVNSWVPKGGNFRGYCIQHSELLTINEYFTTQDQTYQPSVYYVYQPCKATIDSLDELKERNLQLQDATRIIKSEIISGMDELGVLLLGDDFAWWHGSQMTIETANRLIPGESATSVQVVGSMLAAIVWMIKNPRQGYTEPDDLPFEEVLEIGDQYWQDLISVDSDWAHSCNFNDLLL